jgi:hypothetical protein
MSVTKILCDLEMKRLSLAKDLVDIAAVHDGLVKFGMRFAQYVRHFADGESEPELRKVYHTMTSIIAGELNQMAKDLITYLKDPA